MNMQEEILVKSHEISDEQPNVEKDLSIIKIIQKMVKDNESEEKIIQTLESLNVNKDQAKRLLLIAQADTFTLLSSEIKKIVNQEVEEKKIEFKKDIEKYNNSQLKVEQEKIIEKINSDNEKLKREIIQQNTEDYKKVQEIIQKLAQLNENLGLKIEENQKEILKIKEDLEETKLKGVKLKNTLSRTILILFSIICFLSSIALISLNFLIEFNFDFLISAIIMAFIGTITIYLTTNI
jgi:hypothetical protein